MAKARSPGTKLLISVLIGMALVIPLFAVYLLVWDRQSQAETATATNVEGWGGEQTLAGPVLVIPYTAQSVETETVNGKEVSRTVNVEKQLFLSPEAITVDTKIKPEKLTRSIYTNVVYDAVNSGTARFALPADFARYGIDPAALKLASAELRFGVSDARGLQPDGKVSVNGTALSLKPGKGLRATSDSGFFSFVDWSGMQPLNVAFSFTVRGNKAVSLVPRGGAVVWNVSSNWPHPSFYGDFSPTSRKVADSGFTAKHEVSNLALGQDLLLTEDPSPAPTYRDDYAMSVSTKVAGEPSVSRAMTVGLIEPVDLYSQVDRSVKYGFLFIGFTFLAFFMFDVVAGARVAAAEYLLTGAGLVLFFVLLLAFAEVVGFTIAYLIAGGAITALLTAYSAAVLGSWTRAKVIGGLLIGLYAVLFTLLNLEGYALLIGSVLLFAALAMVMWSTRRIDWSKADDDASPVEEATPKADGRAPATVTGA